MGDTPTTVGKSIRLCNLQNTQENFRKKKIKKKKEEDKTTYCIGTIKE